MPRGGIPDGQAVVACRSRTRKERAPHASSVGGAPRTPVDREVETMSEQGDGDRGGDRTDGDRIDGRTARAQRTRAAIVDAHLALLASGDLKPTGERIADAAGVSLRTLWTSFKDMETLFAAAGERLIERELELGRASCRERG